MKRRPPVPPLLGLFSLLIGIWLSASRPFPIHDVIVPAGDCRIPVRVVEPRTPNPAGSVIVLHGISANRRIMQYLGESFASAGLRTFLVDLPGHGDNTDPFSPPRAEACAAGLLLEFSRSGQILPERTALVGHSMGAAMSIRLAEHFSAAATIAVSPAPMGGAAQLPRGFILFDRPGHSPANLLLLRGALEPRTLDAADRSLLAAAGGERISTADFPLGRAAHLEILPGATHTSLLFDPRVPRASLVWLQHVFPIQETDDPSPGRHAFGGLLGLAGLFLLFPTAARAITPRLAKPSSIPNPHPRSPLLLCATVALTSIASVLSLRFWNPLRSLHILTADYLTASMLLTGLIILLLFGKNVSVLLSFRSAPILAASFLGLATVLLLGLWANWHLTDAWMSLARALRFLPLVAVLFPYHAVEEILLASAPRQTSVHRLLLFLLFRFILWLAWIGGLFFLQSGQILLLLLTPFFLVLFLLQRLATETVLLTTASRAAAALYGAILTAWLLAASLPLT